MCVGPCCAARRHPPSKYSSCCHNSLRRLCSLHRRPPRCQQGRLLHHTHGRRLARHPFHPPGPCRYQKRLWRLRRWRASCMSCLPRAPSFCCRARRPRARMRLPRWAPRRTRAEAQAGGRAGRTRMRSRPQGRRARSCSTSACWGPRWTRRSCGRYGSWSRRRCSGAAPRRCEPPRTVCEAAAPPACVRAGARAALASASPRTSWRTLPKGAQRSLRAGASVQAGFGGSALQSGCHVRPARLSR